MAYSQARHPNDPTHFPSPPLWLVWYAQPVYGEQAAVESLEGITRGQVRHLPTLAKAKRQVAPPGRASRYLDDDRVGRFWYDWAIYEWVSGEYVLRYSGKKDEHKSTCSLFDPPPRKPRKPSKKKQEELDAIESIRALLSEAS